MKVVLFDADGVLTLPEEFFSRMYARSRGLDDAPFEKFFKEKWEDFVLGKRDLKEHIKNNNDLWRWNGTPDEMIAFWCKSEDVRNDELLKIVDELRQNSIKCFVATQQERYRAQYMKDVMFKDRFDGFFVTADIGLSKDDPKFYQHIIAHIQTEHPEVTEKDIIMFDDSGSKLKAAERAGIDARLYVSNDQVRAIVKA